MKTMARVSFAALLLSGLVLAILGARIWSAPDVFALEIGQPRLPAALIGSMALKHGALLLGLGLFALAAAFLSNTARWLALGLLIAAGIAAWFGVWQFDLRAGNVYAAALKTLLAADLIGFAAITALRDADRPGPEATGSGAQFRWG